MSTRRRADFLIKTLGSIQRQTVRDFEVIVSDNDPAESARAVVEGLNDPRIHYYCNGEDLGMNASFNRSLARARGQYVVMITDDDPIYPEMLEILQDLTVKHPGLGAYFGGCDVLQVNPKIARFTLHRVGNNSTLAPLNLGTVRAYTAETYPHAFFSGELQMYTLWSTGMVKREIAQEIGGLPNYGSPYLGDYAYIVACGSHSGCAVINQSLGCQAIHDSNYGRKECGELKTAATGFSGYIKQRFSQRSDWAELQLKMEKFLGQWIVLHSLFLKQFFKEFNIKDHNLYAVLPELFKIPYVRRCRHYFYLGGLFMNLQRMQTDIRNAVLRRMRRN